MLTVKTTGIKAEPNEYVGTNSEIYLADKVVERIDERNGQKHVLLYIYARNGMNTAIETHITLDSACVHGPATVFVENASGKTVQRITTNVPWENLNIH